MSDKFAVGDIVCRKLIRRTVHLNIGKVYGAVLDDPSMLVVEWNYGYLNKEKIDDLVTKEEAEQTKDKYNAEFAVVQEKLRDKMRAATEALEQANILAKSFGEQLCELDDDVTADFRYQSSLTGWNTSSWNC